LRAKIFGKFVSGWDLTEDAAANVATVVSTSAKAHFVTMDSMAASAAVLVSVAVVIALAEAVEIDSAAAEAVETVSVAAVAVASAAVVLVAVVRRCQPKSLAKAPASSNFLTDKRALASSCAMMAAKTCLFTSARLSKLD
jgi:hypothetical protein